MSSGDLQLAQWGSMVASAARTCDARAAGPTRLATLKERPAEAGQPPSVATPSCGRKSPRVVSPTSTEDGDDVFLAQMSRSSQWMASLKAWLMHHGVCSGQATAA